MTMTSDTWTLTPAYGRDYKSAGAAVKDFADGKDFILNSVVQTTYCSIRDFPKDAAVRVNLRYQQLSKVTTFIVDKGNIETPV